MCKTSTLSILEDDRKLSKYILENFKNIDITSNNGSEVIISATNIKKIIPITYKIKSSKINLTILYFKCDDIKDRKYYIPKLKQDFTLPELKDYLKSVL